METKSDNRIKALRLESGLTQSQLATELGVLQATISAYEAGKHYPSVEVLLQMSSLFGVSLDYIMGLSDMRQSGKAMESASEEEELLNCYESLSWTITNFILSFRKRLRISSSSVRSSAK